MREFQGLSSRVIIIVTICLLLATLVISVSIPTPKTVEAQLSPSWWDTDWTYRTLIEVTENSGANFTNYSTQIQFDDDGFNYSNVDGANGSDLRFATSNGTECDYWIETWNTSGESTVWVEIPSLPASDTTSIYMYYGNSGASAASNKTATYYVWDDFDDGTLSDNWSWNNEPTTWDEGETTAGRLYMLSEQDSDYCGNQENGNGIYQMISGDFEAECKLYGTPNENTEQSGLLVMEDDDNIVKCGYGYFWLFVGGTGPAAFREINNACSLRLAIVNLSSPKYLKIRRIGTSWYTYYHNDGTTTWTAITDWTQTLNDPVQVGVGVADGGDLPHSNYPSEFEYISVRKYASPEPSFVLGAEETASSWCDYFGGNASVSSSNNIAISSGDAAVDDISDSVNVFPANDTIFIAIPGTSGAGTGHWDRVADAVDGTTVQTGLCAGTSWYNDLYTPSLDANDYPVGEIYTVTMRARCNCASASYASVKPLFYDGDMHTGNTWSPNGLFVFTNLSQNITSWRDTWDWEDIRTCLFGLTLKGGTCLNAVGCTQLYFDIDYALAGNITSDALTPSPLTNWEMFYGNHTIPAGANITYQIWDASDDSTLCTMTAAEAAAGYDISSCANTTSSIKIFADLQASSSASPTIHFANVTWNDNAPPAVNAPILWDTEAIPDQVTNMTPQVEYNAKANVTDSNTLNDLSTVKLTIFYDSDGSYSVDDVPTSGSNQTAAILTWTNGGSPAWTIDPGNNTSWSIETGSCVAPTLTGTSGIFEFHFKAGKVSAETVNPAKWHIYAKADDGEGTGANYTANKGMNWYGEITVNTSSVDWGNIAAGSDFSDNPLSSISVTYISNGNYTEQIKASSPWGNTTTLALNASGSPGSNEFSIKADDTATLGSAVLVSSGNYTTLDSGIQTLESGNIEGNNTLWLKLASVAPKAVYDGTIYYQIAED